MLLALAIRDVVLIEALDLEFSGGLTVITGETGTGKSILLDALGLALGNRAATGLVRQGAGQATVTATFARDAGLDALLVASEIAVDADEPLIVRRTVRADGGSRAFVNDQPVSGALLRSVGEQLVEIHGQHDDRGLLVPAGHRALLDAFGRCDITAVSRAFAEWRRADSALTAARDAVAHAEADRDWLTHAVGELAALDPQPDEEETLATSRSAMQKGAKISDDLAVAEGFLSEAEGGLSRLRQAARVLDRIAGDHPALGEALAAIDRAIIEASMAEDHLRTASETLAFDPARLEAEETRLFELRAMARKHRVQPDDLAALCEQLRSRLAAVEAGNEGLAQLEDEVMRARQAYESAAKALTSMRRESAVRLDAAVARELAPLKLDAARFQTVVASGPESESGADRVEFEVSTNPGAPFGPLLKIASGGELSRFILALKVALAEEGAAGTMIFDEIDRGVGGAVASAIGDRLARLAQKTQVLVVTHSPQVAARGDRHLLIAKNSDGRVTRTNLRVLDDLERREEIARMLSGAEVTDEARAQAAKLVAA